MECITLIFSGLVAVSTIVYAVLTRKLVSETKLMRKSQYEPYILISLSTAEAVVGIAYLTIANIGQGVAKDVTFKVLKGDDIILSINPERRKAFFTNGIKYFPPQKEFKNVLGDMQEIPKDEEIKIVVSYKDIFSKQRTETFCLNFSEIGINSHLTPPDTYLG